MTRTRKYGLAAALCALVLAAGCVTASALAPTKTISCTITSNTLSCPLPAAPTATVTKTATVTATVTATPAAPAPSTSDPAPSTSSAAPTPSTSTSDPAPSTSSAAPAPAASTSEAPAPADTNCAAAPSACGYPDATNTGPAAGALVVVPDQLSSGPGWEYEANFQRIRITSPNTVIDHIQTRYPIVIDAQHATVSNSVIAACGFDSDQIAIRAGNPGNGYDGGAPRIINNRMSCDNSAERPRSSVRDVYGGVNAAVVQGNDMSGAGNCVTIELSGTITDNWCHDLGHVSGDHHSGFSNHGGASGVVYVHNTALLANTSTSGGGGLSGAITVYGDFARAQNVTAQDNLIDGGAYTMYGGINNEDKYGQPMNVQLLSNRLLCGSWVYGPMFVRATTVVDGNYCDQDKSAVSR